MKKGLFLLFIICIDFGSLFCQIYPTNYSVTNIVGVRNSMNRDVLIQPDGKLITCGYDRVGNDSRFLLLRYLNSGILDKSFGHNGIILTEFSNMDIVCNSLALQADQKIVVAGITDYTWDNIVILCRYNDDGSLDNSFGINGRVTIEPDPDLAEDFGYTSVDIQADGKILVSVGMDNLVNNGFVVFRLNSNGTIDESFGNSGKVETDFANGGTAHSIKSQSDGKIVVSGNNPLETIIVRYNNDGALDHTFGNNGILSESRFYHNYNRNSLVLQEDGKILVAGTFTNSDTHYIEFGLLRCNHDGTIDNSFGTNGMVTTGITDYNLRGNTLSIQSDGKIIVAGTIFSGDYYDIIVTRYHSNGSPDNTFGDNGIVITNAGTKTDVANSVAVQSDDKIVIAGYLYAPNDEYSSSSYPKNLILRYNADGTIDTAFGNQGISTITYESEDIANSVVVSSDTLIILAGSSDSTLSMVRYNQNCYRVAEFGSNGYVRTDTYCTRVYTALQPENNIITLTDSCVFRFNSDGMQDTSFGTNGMIILDSMFTNQVMIQPDEKILLSGYSADTNADFIMLRYSADGLSDLSFGDQGIVVADFNNYGDYCYASAVQSDGKLILAGDTKVNDSFDQPPDMDIAIARFNEDGTIDHSFGVDGLVTTKLSSGYDHCNSIALQPDDKILLTGTSENSLIVLRYNPSGELDTTFGTNGIISSDLGRFGNKVIWQATEKILVLVDSMRVVCFNINGEIDEAFHNPVLINCGSNEGLIDMAVNDDSEIVIAGTFDHDFLVMKIPQDGFNDFKILKSTGDHLLVYPNPVRNSFNISYYIDNSEGVTLKLYDSNGKLIQNYLINECRSAGSHFENFQLEEELPSGIYILQFRTHSSMAGVKIIKE